MGAAQIRSRPKNLRPNFQNANFQNALTRLWPGRRLIVPIAVRAGGGGGAGGWRERLEDGTFPAWGGADRTFSNGSWP